MLETIKHRIFWPGAFYIAMIALGPFAFEVDIEEMNPIGTFFLGGVLAALVIGMVHHWNTADERERKLCDHWKI